MWFLKMVTMKVNRAFELPTATPAFTRQSTLDTTFTHRTTAALWQFSLAIFLWQRSNVCKSLHFRFTFDRHTLCKLHSGCVHYCYYQARSTPSSHCCCRIRRKTIVIAAPNESSQVAGKSHTHTAQQLGCENNAE